MASNASVGFILIPILLLFLFLLFAFPVAHNIRNAFDFATLEEHYLTTTPPGVFFLRRLRKPVIIWSIIWLAAALLFVPVFQVRSSLNGQLVVPPLSIRLAQASFPLCLLGSILLVTAASSFQLVRKIRAYWAYILIVSAVGLVVPIAALLSLYKVLPESWHMLTYTESMDGTRVGVSATWAGLYLLPIAVPWFLIAASNVRSGKLFERR